MSGTSPEALAEEARSQAGQWRLTNYAARLVGQPLLVMTSDDGFAADNDALVEAIRAEDAVQLACAHFATDHSYSNCRIGLQATILKWLTRFV